MAGNTYRQSPTPGPFTGLLAANGLSHTLRRLTAFLRWVLVLGVLVCPQSLS
jgi:hypothetical protein